MPVKRQETSIIAGQGLCDARHIMMMSHTDSSDITKQGESKSYRRLARLINKYLSLIYRDFPVEGSLLLMMIDID